MVTTTARAILQAAYSRSRKNIPGTIGTEGTELLYAIARAMRGLYSIAARINPVIFGEQRTVAMVDGFWARPEDSETVYRIESTDGAEIGIVPFDDRTLLAGMQPAIYQMGPRYYPAGNAGDPVSGSLRFFFSHRPAVPATLDDPLDPTWIESYNQLLANEIAVYLAIKDNRLDEAAVLKEERDNWLRLFVAFLEHETVGESRRFNQPWLTNSRNLVPLGALVAGGSNALPNA